MLADGVATAVMVMGEAGLDFVEQLPQSEVFGQ